MALYLGTFQRKFPELLKLWNGKRPRSLECDFLELSAPSLNLCSWFHLKQVFSLDKYSQFLHLTKGIPCGQGTVYCTITEKVRRNTLKKMFIGQTHHKVYIFTSVAGEHLLNSLCLSSHSLLMTVTVNRTRVLLSLWMMLLASVTVIQMFISGSSISWYTLFFSVNLHKTEIREMLWSFI